MASEMISYILDYAKDKGFKRVELNMWEFNQRALAFYEKVGFKTYRKVHGDRGVKTPRRWKRLYQHNQRR